MTITRFSTTLLVCALASLPACGPPTVALRSPERFSVAEVRRLGWDDRCELQGFFDSTPPANQRVLVRTTPTTGTAAAGSPQGQITVRVSDPRNREMFLRLVNRYYRPLQPLANAAAIDVTVDFYTFCNKPRMLVDSDIVVQTSGQTLRLAYHPCVGEYLLNGDIYRNRQALLAGTR